MNAKTISRIVRLLCFVAIAGCAGSPARISMMSPEKLKTQRAEDLCFAYHMLKGEKTKSELVRRNLLTADEWKLIDQEQVQPGMSQLALICSWGYTAPIGGKAVHEYSPDGDVLKTWYYQRNISGKNKTIRVLIENGIVTKAY